MGSGEAGGRAATPAPGVRTPGPRRAVPLFPVGGAESRAWGAVRRPRELSAGPEAEARSNRPVGFSPTRRPPQRSWGDSRTRV